MKMERETPPTDQGGPQMTCLDVCSWPLPIVTKWGPETGHGDRKSWPLACWHSTQHSCTFFRGTKSLLKSSRLLPSPKHVPG